jgi:hypothetical protein
MRRFLLMAAAAMIALVGLSANQCTGGKEEKAAEPAKTEEPAAAKPAESSDNMGADQGAMSDDKGSMSSDQGSMSGGQDSTSGEDMVDKIPADE